MSGPGILPVQQRSAWERDGILQLRHVLTGDECQILLDAIKNLRTSDADIEGRRRSGKPNSVRLRRIIELSDGFDFLIDHHNVLGVLLDLIGDHVQLLGANAIIREQGSEPLDFFHTDGGPALRMVRWDPAGPALQCKVQFFLTDVSQPDCGNFMFVRGSHRWQPSTYEEGCYVEDANRYMVEKGRYPPGTEQVLADPGDAIIFPHSLWHAVAPNLSGKDRWSVILAYGLMCLRPHEHENLPASVLARLSVRQRRMCGSIDDGPDINYYFPPDQYEIMAGVPASSELG